MASGDIKILDSLSINQNTIGLVISYIGVVYVARLDVDNSSMIVYAIEYCVKKWYKQKNHKLFFKYRRKIVEEHMDNAEAKIDDLVKIKDIFK